MNIHTGDLIHLMKNFGALSVDGVRFLMSKILAAEPEIGWEIGPDPIDETCMVLALTCWGDTMLLGRLESELELPIKGDDWMISAGSPPKCWERYFEILTTDGQNVGIEGDAWMWNLAALDGVAHINLLLPSIFDDKRYDLDCAAFLLLSGEVGEPNFGRFIRIGSIDFGGNLSSVN